MRIVFVTLFLFSFLLPATPFAAVMDEYRIGGHGTGQAIHPDWFKHSLLDLQGDLEDARAAGKRGIIIMFSQKNCFHCQAFIETTLQDATIQRRLRRQYDMIGLDIFSDNELTNIDGSSTTVKNFAESSKARLTPTLLFIGVENKILINLVGLYPPEKFSRVLDYIEGNHFKRMALREYLQQPEQASTGKARPVSFNSKLFEKPPLSLDNNDGRFVLVVFENPNCNPCDRFHQRVLTNEAARITMKNFRTVQLDASDNIVKVTSPAGNVLTPKSWASQLQLNYDVAVVFFDAEGKEVHRLDSEFGKDRFIGSMQYVLEKAYLRHEQFLQWRKEQAMKKKNKN